MNRSTTSNNYRVIASFASLDRARDVVEELRGAGIPGSQISIVGREGSESGTGKKSDTSILDNPGGATAGGLLGGFVGFLIGIGSFAIPGIGPVIGAGVLATTLAGGALGTLTGALVEEGIEPERAKDYQTTVERGGTVLAVQAPDATLAQRARSIIERFGGTQVHQYGSGWSSGTSGSESYDRPVV